GRPPRAWCFTKTRFEGAGKCFGRAKTDRQRDLDDRHSRLRDQSQGADFESSPPQILAQGLAHPGREQAMEVKRGEVRNSGQRLQVERLVEMTVDVLEHAVHPSRVFGATLLERHRLSV